MIKNKIKILFIHHAAGWGGAPISMLNTIKMLDRSKYSFEVLLLRDSMVSKVLQKNNITVKIAKSVFYKRFYKYYTHSVVNEEKWYRVDSMVRSILSWFLNRYYFASRELQNHDYDIVHLNSSTLTDWLAPCKDKGKIVIHIREPFAKGKFGLRHYFLTKQMRKYADKIIAISNDNAKRINILEKTQVVYNFVDIRRSDIIEKFNPLTANVLYLGGQFETKGFFTVVDSLDYLNHDIKIIFCGDFLTSNSESGFLSIIKKTIKRISPSDKKLQESLIKIKNHPNAIYIGLVSSTAQLIQKSEFLISPFTKPHFARPVIEAFAFKKCVVASDVEGMDEIIDHQINGLIIEKNNPFLLAKAINYLHDNPEKRYAMGENGYLKALKQFSTSNIIQIQKIYDSLVV